MDQNETIYHEFLNTTYDDYVSEGDAYNDQFRLAFTVPATILYIAIFVPVWLLILLGNFLVILAFFSTRSLRKVSNYFLVSLAFTDIFTGIISLPLHLVGRLVISPVTCLSSSRFLFFLPTVILSASSVYHLIAIAIDRLISVYKPLKYPNIVTLFRAKIVILVIWVYNIAFGLLPIFIPDNMDPEWTCRAQSYGNEQNVITLVVAGFIPAYLLVMICLYVLMLRKVSQHFRRISHITYAQRKKDENHRRGLVTMTMIVGAFGLCFLPTSFQFTYEVYGRYTLTELIILQTLCEYPLFLNSSINPVIYGIRHDGFNKAMKAIISKKLRTESYKSSG